MHKTQEVRAAYNRLKITPIFNIPYSPDFNGIESYFSLVKSQYKKLLLQLLMKGLSFQVVALIRQAIGNVSDDKVRSCVTNGVNEVLK